MIEMKDRSSDDYDDVNIPDIDYPPVNKTQPTEPLPESERPRQDGPGGN